MAKLKLADTGFALIPEGWYTFKVTGIDYDEDFGRMKVELSTKDGSKHVERYGLLTKSGEVNEGANKAFSYFAKTALNNFSVDEIDTDDLIGCYIKAEVKHVQSETVSEKTGKPFVNVNLGDKEPAYGFNDSAAKPVDDSEDDAADDVSDEAIDLDDFLD